MILIDTKILTNYINNYISNLVSNTLKIINYLNHTKVSIKVTNINNQSNKVINIISSN
jgi:hypothetical protein